MLAAVFSDVHGNLPALEAFLEDVRGQVDAYICLGDVVNYGPWSDRCLEAIVQLPNLFFVRGNHEELFLRRAEYNYSSSLVAAFTEFCQSRFQRTDLISELPEAVQIDRFLATHTLGGNRVFPETDVHVDGDVLIGHSHWQFVVRRGGLIVNPGSVGQNRQRIDRAEYALVDTESRWVTFRSIPYNFDQLMAEMRRLDYPADALEYYERKARTT